MTHPTPQMMNFNIFTPWRIMRPRVFRLMDSQYVDAFFEDGSLRLSSFARFAQHSDEARKDEHEGSGIRVGRGNEMTIFSVHGTGTNCYVLCGTTTDTERVRSQFPGADGCFVIDDLMGFGSTVSLELPYFDQGLEGPAIYQDDPTIYKDVGALKWEDIEEKHKRPDGTISMVAIPEMAMRVGGPEEMFIKPAKYADQSEYRILWSVRKQIEPFIDIKAPAARQFCRRVR
ncbi:hypothetical protein HFO21_02625 [Rhizobium laguerreae]|nr:MULTISPECIES: hypothetical protein [Rhizobium]MBY3135114.1 hypothetical protein [Rhizobium laguerreae]MBY3213308.1 hypothetical protein [Rhizobium laguerreae]MBY5776160.1 hypothetical protein [Rhizobium leguminosarum]